LTLHVVFCALLSWKILYYSANAADCRSRPILAVFKIPKQT